MGYLSSVSSYETNGSYGTGDYSTKREVEFEYDRQDFDLIAGYMLNPRFGIFTGLKYLVYEYHSPSVTRIYATTYDYTDTELNGEKKSIGPALGVTANYPFSNNNFVTSISLTTMYLWHDVENVFSNPNVKNNNLSSDGLAFSIEPGVSYIMNDKISFTLGLRYQHIFESNHDDLSNDQFYGVSLGCDYRFL